MPGTPRNSTLPRSSKPGARADHQVTHGARDQDFAGAGLAEDPRGDVYGEPPDVVAQEFAFAGVDASADLDAQCFGVSAQGLGAADGLRRAVEGGESASTIAATLGVSRATVYRVLAEGA